MQESVLRFFQSIQNPFLDKFFTYVTMMGEQYFTILIIAWIYWNYSKKEGFILSFIFIISSMVNSLMKVIFHTQRPFQKLNNFEGKRIHTAVGHSFPSGHTQGATTLFVALAMIFKKPGFMIMAIVLSLIVATSRMYLGVHWPIDVVVGFILGCLIVFLSYGYLNSLYNRPEVFYRFLVLILALFYAVILIVIALNEFFLEKAVKIENYYRLIGIATGSVSGFILEEKKFPYSVVASRLKKYLRFIIGIAGTLGLLVGLKYILPENAFGILLRYFFVGAWITGIFPFLGLKLKLFDKEVLS